MFRRLAEKKTQVQMNETIVSTQRADDAGEEGMGKSKSRRCARRLRRLCGTVNAAFTLGAKVGDDGEKARDAGLLFVVVVVVSATARIRTSSPLQQRRRRLSTGWCVTTEESFHPPFPLEGPALCRQRRPQRPAYTRRASLRDTAATGECFCTGRRSLRNGDDETSHSSADCVQWGAVQRPSASKPSEGDAADEAAVITRLRRGGACPSGFRCTTLPPRKTLSATDRN